MAPLFMLPGRCDPVTGVKQTLRLDAICELGPGFASCIFLNRDLKRKRLSERLTKPSHWYCCANFVMNGVPGARAASLAGASPI